MLILIRRLILHMSKDKDIRNKVIATVIGGIILSALGYALYAAPNVFRWIGRVLRSIWNYLTSSSNVPNWLLWLLIIVSAVTAIKLIRRLFKRDKIIEPTFRMYTEDSFEGATWRWSWDYYDKPVNILPYCPICDSQLVYVRPNEFSLRPALSVAFYCETCKKERVRIEGERFIDRKIRNGEWKRLIKRDGLTGGDK
jgi:hypothetical protein